MARPLLITDPDSLALCVERLRGAARIGLDTEGNGMHAYRTRLCVVQVCDARPDASADEVYIIDAIALSDLSPLVALLGPSGPEKIVHDVSFDARLLALSGLPLARVLDTSIHARFLGVTATGLGALLATRHGVVLSKALQHEDWARRPFTPEQLDYLTEDVAHLGLLAAGLESEARAQGIADEVAVETEYALECARAEENRGPAYARLKGARDLPPAARAALREMAALREATAERWNVPVGCVVSNQGLVAAARARPRTVAEIKRVAGLYERSAAIAADLLAAYQRGERQGDVPESERAFFERARMPTNQVALRKGRETVLSAWRKAEAAARGVDIQVVLPGHVLQDLVNRGPRTYEELAAIPGFGEVRVLRYGDTILALIAQADKASSTRN